LEEEALTEEGGGHREVQVAGGEGRGGEWPLMLS